MPRLALICLQAVILGVAELATEDVQLGTAKVQLELVVNVVRLLLQSLVEAIEGFLEVFLLVFRCL